MPRYKLTEKTARQHASVQKKKKRNSTNTRTFTHANTNTQLRLRGWIVTGAGTKQLSAFCHVKPRRNTHDRKQRPRHHGGLLPLSHTQSLYYFVLQWWKEVCTSQRFLSPNYFSAYPRLQAVWFTLAAFSPLVPLKKLHSNCDVKHVEGKWIKREVLTFSKGKTNGKMYLTTTEIL